MWLTLLHRPMPPRRVAGEGGLFADFEGHVRVPQATFPGMTRIAGRARVALGHVGTVVVLPPQA